MLDALLVSYEEFAAALSLRANSEIRSNPVDDFRLLVGFQALVEPEVPLDLFESVESLAELYEWYLVLSQQS